MQFWRVWFLILFSGTTISTMAQTYELVREIDGEFDQVATDNLGGLYTASRSELVKYTPNGDVILRNGLNLLGEVSSLDCSNALKLVVFYGDLSQVVFLDNQLAPRGEALQLDMLGYAQSSVVSSSYNNGLWVFDQLSFSLVRLDDRLQETSRTASLLQLLGEPIEPIQLIEGKQWLYLLDKQHGIYVFDLFGTYYKRIPVLEIDHLDVTNGIVFAQKGSELYLFDPVALSEQPISISQDDVVSFAVHGEFIYRITPKSLQIFKQVLR